MKWIVALGLVGMLGGLGAAAWWFFALPGPQQLDTLDRWYPGERNAARVAEGEVFDPDTGLALDIWAPAEAVSARHPVVVFFYGGSWRSGERAHYGFVGRALANRGFVVVVADYRKVPDVRFPAFLEDGAKAVAWTLANIDRFGGDPDRLFLAGQSAGAYLAVMLALDRQWLGREGVRADRIAGVAGLSGPYDFYPFKRDSTRDAFGRAARPEMTQPINFARADAAPLWLATGTDDTLVEPRNSRALTDAILEAGGDAELALYPGVDHPGTAIALAKPFRRKGAILDEMVAFFKTRQTRLSSTPRP